MLTSRNNLVKSFQQAESVPLSEVKSLNEWQLKKSKDDTPLAGALAYKGSLPYLVGHNHELLLENFTEHTPVFLGASGDPSFTAKDLRDGDKIVVSFKNKKINKVRVLSLNLLDQGISVFDHQQKWFANRKWRQFVEKVEKFFTIQKFYKAQTPNLVVCPGLEPTLDPFSVRLIKNNTETKLFLPTSPELHLKKVIAQGVTEIFEITPCFRNDEAGHQHQPEFTMLEWYRSYKKLIDLTTDIQKLIFFLTQGQEQPKFTSISISELFKKYVDFDLKPHTTQKQILQLALSLNLSVSSEDSFDDIFFIIFIDKIEPHLGKSGVDFIFNYPPSQSALAQINKEGWADRFEMYWHGYEIANAFNELTCAKTQRERFEQEQKHRAELGKEFIPIDEEFMSSLTYGLPPTVGIAMGLERLFMACYNIRNIQDVRPFPY